MLLEIPLLRSLGSLRGDRLSQGAAPLSTMTATALDDARAAPLYGNDQLDVP